MLPWRNVLDRVHGVAFGADVFKRGRWIATGVLILHAAVAALCIVAPILPQLDFAKASDPLICKAAL